MFFQLILSIFTAFFLGRYFDSSVVAFFYTASSCFIEILLFTLPFIVFSFIFLSVFETKNSSFKLILLIFIGIFVSNSVALYTSYFFSKLVLPIIDIDYSPNFFTKFNSTIEPIIKLNLPRFLQTDKSMILAAVLGLTVNALPDRYKIKGFTHKTVYTLNKIVLFFLNRIVIPLLPLYVFGFCLKLSFDQALILLFQSYGKVFIASMLLVIGYLFMLYLVGAGGNGKEAWNQIKKMLPAGVTGFSTMSSTATLPYTLKCTEAATQDRNFTNLIIPATSNIHMLGDDLTIVAAAMTLLGMFGLPLPDFGSFMLFASAFCVAKLSCVGIPGASVLVVLPVLQNYLNFTPEMTAVLTTIYILQDPFGTMANVMGNGGFALLIHRFIKTKPILSIKAEDAI